jgi:hypothetical protein
MVAGRTVAPNRVLSPGNGTDNVTGVRMRRLQIDVKQIVGNMGDPGRSSLGSTILIIRNTKKGVDKPAQWGHIVVTVNTWMLGEQRRIK